MTETTGQPAEIPARFADAPRAASHGGFIHTCNGPVITGLPFGRKNPDTCARCWDMVTNDAPARADHAGATRGRRARLDAERSVEIKKHFVPGGPHDTGACGPVCTAFDW